MKKVLFTATVDSHIKCFHIPYLKYFKEQGYIVHVATNGCEEIPYCDLHITIPFRRNPYDKNNIKAIKMLKKLIETEDYDLIHTHTPMGSVVTRLANLKKRSKIIYTAHGFHFFKHAPLKNWLIYYPIEKILSRVTDTIITINKEDYEKAKKKFHCNVELIKGVGIDPDKFNNKLNVNKKNKLKKSLGLKDNDFAMIYPAELSVNKNQLFLFDVMEKLIKKHPNIHLLLPGKNTWNYPYDKLLKNKKLINNVHLLGYRNDINDLLKISDLSISSSKREGLPVNVLEAIISNVPVVAYNCRGMNELIKNNVNGFTINTFEVDKFINKIMYIYNKKLDFTKLKKYNDSFIKDYYIDNVLADVKKIYNRKIKILHLLSSTDYSGAENVACSIIENTDNYESLYCSKDGYINKILNDKKINHCCIKKIDYKNVKKVVKKFKPDIIQAHDYRASFVASSFSKQCRIISLIHCDPAFAHFWNYKTLAYSKCIKKFDTIIFVSNCIYENAIYKNKISNYKVIYNYVDKTKVFALSKDIYKKHFDIFFIGRLVNEKNPIEFIETIKKLNNVSACMIGNGPLYKKCKKLIKKYNLNIELLGYKNNPYKVIKNCKFGIMPSLSEGFGLTAIESMILGKPILNSGAGGLKEIFKNNKEFICANYVDKANLLLNDKKIYRKYCEKLEKIIEPYCNLNEWKNKYIDVYEKKQ